MVTPYSVCADSKDDDDDAVTVKISCNDCYSADENPSYDNDER